MANKWRDVVEAHNVLANPLFQECVLSTTRITEIALHVKFLIPLS